MTLLDLKLILKPFQYTLLLLNFLSKGTIFKAKYELDVDSVKSEFHITMFYYHFIFIYKLYSPNYIYIHI